MEKNGSDQAAEDQEEQTAPQAEDETASHGFFQEFHHRRAVPGSLGGADRRHQHGSHGVCDCGGEEDARHRHAGQHPVCT